MRLLLDSHTMLWMFADPDRLSEAAGAAIAAEENEVLVSVVSPWELEIKRAKGKLKLHEELGPALASLNVDVLPITLAHVLAVESLPLRHHDPFDRILVAQAQVEGLTLVTADRAMREYPIATLAAT